MPADGGVEPALPLLQVFLFLLEGLTHLRHLLPPSSPLLEDGLAEDVRHAHEQIRLPELEGVRELCERGLV
jgi:hypothetical protein